MPAQHAAKRWCFTINNYTAAERQSILDSAGDFDYLIVAREYGDSGTPHLQGYFILKTKCRLRQVKALSNGIFRRAHLEVSRGTPQEASDYCKKGYPDPHNDQEHHEADFEEFGELPSTQGKRTDFEKLDDWLEELKEQGIRPTDRQLYKFNKNLSGRYWEAAKRAREFCKPAPKLVNRDMELRPWQRRVNDLIGEPADDRKIIFVVDENGNSGKSLLVRYLVTKNPDTVQPLRNAKRDDMAHAIDPERSIFLIDVPRGNMQFLQYTILEQLKDRMVFSPKYQSGMKIVNNGDNVHVVVFCNEDPDRTALTDDRYRVINLRRLT